MEKGKEEPLELAKSSTNKESVRLIVQRFRKCSLLVHGKVVTVGSTSNDDIDLVNPKTTTSCGLLAYISFGMTATPERVLQAATTLINLPILTLGVWGDGETETKSILDMSTAANAESSNLVQLVLVPQANLISKIRSQGRSIQYHDQIDKQRGKELYELFVDYVKALCLQHEYQQASRPTPKFVTDLLLPSSKQSQPPAVDASIPPDQMFQNDPRYNSNKLDDKGIPLENAAGEPLTKSAIKKLVKIQGAHAKKHAKYLQQPAQATAKTPAAQADSSSKTVDWSLLTSIQIVAGTFSGRQGLEIASDMGPFCHVINI